MTRDIVEDEIRKIRRRFLICDVIQGSVVALFLLSAFIFVHSLFF